MSKSIFAKLRDNLNKRGYLTEMVNPDNYITTGNMGLNYRITGNYRKGIPNRRSVIFWGEQGTGKSYLVSNAALNAQKQGYQVIYIDTEFAMSEDYMRKIGVDIDDEEKFMVVNVPTIERAFEMCSEMFQTLDPNGKYCVILDSLGMMVSEKESEDFRKGDMKGDQGQIAKKLKLFMKQLNNRIPKFDMFFIATAHAYLNQDIMNGEGKWIMSGGKSFQYAPSVSVLLNKAKLKDDADKSKINGVIIKTETTKTRFTAPNGKTDMRVPYNTGMNEYDGLLEIMVENGHINKNGGWYNYLDSNGVEKKFQKSKFMDHVDELLTLSETAIEETDEYDDLFDEVLDDV